EVAAAAARRQRAAAPHHLVFVGPAGTGAEDAAAEFIPVGEWRGDRRDAVEAGRLAGRAIDVAVDLARSGAVDALVTGPIDKAALNAAGFAFPGHTEMLASRCGIADVVMMMSAEHTAPG